MPFKVGEKVVFSAYGKKNFFGHNYKGDSRAQYTYTIVHVRRLRARDRDEDTNFYDVRSDEDESFRLTTIEEISFEPLRKLIKKRSLPDWW
jgi:hypothetical protein